MFDIEWFQWLDEKVAMQQENRLSDRRSILGILSGKNFFEFWQQE